MYHQTLFPAADIGSRGRGSGWARPFRTVVANSATLWWMKGSRSV